MFSIFLLVLRLQHAYRSSPPFSEKTVLLCDCRFREHVSEGGGNLLRWYNEYDDESDTASSLDLVE